MAQTPPQQRHHLPFSVGAKARRNEAVCGGAKFNQVFLATCVASFILQLFGSILSWHSSNTVLRLNSRVEDQLRGGRRAEAIISLQEEESSTSLSSKVAVAQKETPAAFSSPNTALQFGPPPHSGRLRILVGILTADFPNDQAYRKRHRKLFQLWNDPRVCSLPEFKARSAEERYQCQFIYAFVLGGNPEAAPELVDDSRPMEVTKPIRGQCADLNQPDTILLNIRENMNEGKSQTWMKYGAEIAEEYDLDYVTKCDADTLLHLHEFFKWAYVHLPPAPYNKHIYAGALRDKAYWPRHETEQERVRFESFFGNNYEGVHLYVAGQIYIVSTDLAKFIGQEALTSKCSYCEGHEDHDISAMAFHSPDPIKLMVIGRSHRFWEHPVKGEPRWRRIWAREQARMAGVPFEGKVFNKNSSFDAVMKEVAQKS